MNIHFLGTTGYHPNNRRHTACVMLPELGVIFDAGTGMFRARDLIQTDQLDIFLSHVHLDHSVGLTFLLDVLQGRETGVRVHVEPEKADALTNGLYHPLLFPVEPSFDFASLLNDEWTETASGASVMAFPLEHPGGSHGFRLESDETSIAYVTDTTATSDADYIEKIRGVDLLIHECYFGDGMEEFAEVTGHSCLTPVAEVAKAADVGRMVLVHISPLDESDNPLDLASVASIYDEIQVAEDGLVISV